MAQPLGGIQTSSLHPMSGSLPTGRLTLHLRQIRDPQRSKATRTSHCEKVEANSSTQRKACLWLRSHAHATASQWAPQSRPHLPQPSAKCAQKHPCPPAPALSQGSAMALRPPRSYLFGREHTQGAAVLSHGHAHLGQQGFPGGKGGVSRCFQDWPHQDEATEHQQDLGHAASHVVNAFQRPLADWLCCSECPSLRPIAAGACGPEPAERWSCPLTFPCGWLPSAAASPPRSH